MRIASIKRDVFLGPRVLENRGPSQPAWTPDQFLQSIGCWPLVYHGYYGCVAHWVGGMQAGIYPSWDQVVLGQASLIP